MIGETDALGIRVLEGIAMSHGWEDRFSEDVLQVMLDSISHMVESLPLKAFDLTGRCTLTYVSPRLLSAGQSRRAKSAAAISSRGKNCLDAERSLLYNIGSHQIRLHNCMSCVIGSITR